jgi:hypothetical protein
VSRQQFNQGLIIYKPNDTQYAHRIAYRLLYRVGITVILLSLLLLGVSACAEQPTPYRPPTIAVRATALVVASVIPSSTAQPIETSLPLVTPTCTNTLTYLEDLSLPDGTIVKPGENLDKRWLVQNSGTCNWDERYRLKFISGAELSAPIDQALYPARSGTQATLRISFTAPSEPGTYQSAWQAYDPQGQAFGDPVYLQVVVESVVP